jgi:hypothetical protein
VLGLKACATTARLTYHSLLQKKKKKKALFKVKCRM